VIRIPSQLDGAASLLARGRALAARAQGWLASRATTVPFRLAVALVLLGLQIALAIRSGDRFNTRFNVAPDRPPHFQNPATDWDPRNWDRLIVSRWDSGNYIALGLRGYQYCPPRGPTLPAKAPGCNLAFYPTYGLLGRWLGRITGMPIDFALWTISLVSSFLFLFLWTGKELTSRLGVAETYLALLLLNTFTSGYSLVMVQTEPLTLMLAIGAFVAFARRRHVLGALLAGAASGVRITGIAIGLAYAVGLLIDLVRERPRTVWPWVRAALLMVVCVWGQLTLMAYHAHRFGDPLTYIHAHALLFKHDPSLGALFPPNPNMVVMSMDVPHHDGIWLAAALLWFVLGHREALARFPADEQAFWYSTYLATVGIATVGMMPIALAGMHRYLLLAFPLFFAMAAVMRRRPLLLVLWVTMSAWHYWNVDLCTYTGGMGDHVLAVCHAPHWIRR
jgi:hypothetical protein